VRYAFLTKVAINVTPPAKVPLVAVAHHADDQAETLLLNLVRGSGLQGLGAMRPLTELKECDRTIRLVRPLLGVRRTTILAYANAHGLAWREDPTNTMAHYLRNQVRHEILPRLAQINPNIVATLGRTADITAADAARLAQSDEQTLQLLACGELTSERVVLDLMRFLTLDEGTQRGVLRRAFIRLTPNGPEPGFEQIEGLLAQVRRQTHASGPHPLAGDLAWTVVGVTRTAPLRLSLHCAGALPVAPAHPYLDESWRNRFGAAPLPQAGGVETPRGWQLQVQRLAVNQLPADWRKRSDPWAAYLDADQVGEPLLTTPRHGQQIAPLGMGGRHKAVGDLFTDAKIPPALRGGWPLILDGASQTVLWVCGLAVAHTARIAEKTATCLCLQWRHPAVEPCAPM
jgi:tRNA(Ile)-lysidine synthase